MNIAVGSKVLVGYGKLSATVTEVRESSGVALYAVRFDDRAAQKRNERMPHFYPPCDLRNPADYA